MCKTTPQFKKREFETGSNAILHFVINQPKDKKTSIPTQVTQQYNM